MITDEIMKSRYLAAQEFLPLPNKEPEGSAGVLPQFLSDPKQAPRSGFPLERAAISQALK